MILSKKLNRENNNAEEEANGSGNFGETSTDSDRIISE